MDGEANGRFWVKFTVDSEYSNVSGVFPIPIHWWLRTAYSYSLIIYGRFGGFKCESYLFDALMSESTVP